MKFFKFIPAIALGSLLFTSCKKDQVVQDANYPAQQIYLPSAVENNSPAGVYNINALAVPGQSFRYVVDVANNKLSIPLGVYRSGVSVSGAIPVNIAINTDTVNTLITKGSLPVGTELLPNDKYTFTPTITIADNQGVEKFSLDLTDLNFLLANATKKYAIALGVSSPQVATSKLGTTVILLDPAFLIPTAQFSTLVTVVPATTTTPIVRRASFTNSSTNGVNFSWTFGDGSAAVTTISPIHVYAAAGTYTVTLTTFGALGEKNKAVSTQTVLVP